MRKEKIIEILKRAFRKEGYKDYLTSAEEHELLKLDKLLDTLDGVIKDFNSKGNITPFERKNLRTGLTVLEKAMYSILKRQSYDSFENIKKKSEKLILYVVDDAEHKRMKREINNTLQTSESIRESLLDLCGVSMEMNCRDCTKESRTCLLYREFQKDTIAEPSGEHFEDKKCKYAYRW